MTFELFTDGDRDGSPGLRQPGGTSTESSDDRREAHPEDAGGIAWPRWFVLVGFVFGMAFVLALPPMVPPDELSHFLRVSTMADGWLVPPLTAEPVPDYDLDGCVVSLVIDQGSATDGWSERFVSPRCGPRADARTTIPAYRRTEIYTPIVYAPAVVGYRLGAVGGAAGSLYGARIAQLLTYLAVVGAAIRLIPRGKPLLFAAGLLPVALQGAVGVSADPATVAFAFLLVALILRASDRARAHAARSSRSSLVALAAVGVALGLSKSAYLPLIVMVVTIPTSAFGSVRRRVGWVAGTIGAAVVGTAAWTFGVVNHLQVSTRKGFDSEAEARWVMQNPLEFLTSVGRSWTDAGENSIVAKGLVAPVFRLAERPDVPIAVAVAVAVSLVVIRVLDPPVGRWLERRATPFTATSSRRSTSEFSVAERTLAVACVVIAIGATVVLTQYGLFITGNTRGRDLISGFQGRYFIPLISLALFGVELSRAPRLPARSLVWIIVASSALLAWWLVVSVRFYNGWF